MTDTSIIQRVEQILTEATGFSVQLRSRAPVIRYTCLFDANHIGRSAEWLSAKIRDSVFQAFTSENVHWELSTLKNKGFFAPTSKPYVDSHSIVCRWHFSVNDRRVQIMAYYLFQDESYQAEAKRHYSPRGPRA